MTESIFISYRRDDAASEAMLIRDALRREFGDKFAFMDTSSLQAGSEWPKRIKTVLVASKAVLAVIGPDWLRAGSNEWGQRRIDDESDWVRKELETAFSENKRIIPVLVEKGKIPPAKVLPEPLKALETRQAISIRRDYWDHDIKLLLAQVVIDDDSGSAHNELDPYPTGVRIGPDALSEDKLQQILEKELLDWKKLVSPLPEKPEMPRIELFREYKFKSFAEAIQFMSQVAAGCDIAMHHPRWENIWKTVRVYLSTWDIDHRLSDRDIQLARYFDWAYDNFPGAAKPNKNRPF
jgi:pterin-4a-carbinolamine dehydratase